MVKLVIAALCLMGMVAHAQTYNSINTKTKEKIDSTYNALIEKNKVVGMSVALVKDGEIIYANGYGYQDKEQERKADENSIYRIGSCTKSFTALAIMQLQEEGKLNIKDPIQKYLPQLTIQSRFSKDNPISIQSILTHSSGLPSDLLNGFFCDNPPSIDWVIEQANKCTMAAPAGYQNSYSNLGYGMLGKLIETVSGQSYEAYITEHIFNPLGMTNSFIVTKAGHEAHISKGYMNEKEYAETMIRDQAAGLIHSSVVDMAHYVNMYLADGKGKNAQIVNAASVAEMEADGTKDLVLKPSEEWGYGLYSYYDLASKDGDTTEARVIGHGGDTWAFHADFKYIPELNIGAVVLTNTNTGGRVRNAIKLISTYLKEEEGIALRKKKGDVGNAGDQLCKADEVKGTYYFSGIKMNVENPEKIKIKQGSSKIILTPKNDSCEYSAKVRVFGLIPVKVKHQEFKFVDYQGDTYFKVISTASKSENYIAVKSQSNNIPEAWKAKMGKYRLVGDFFACEDCPNMNYKDMTMELSEDDGVLTAAFEATTKDTKKKLYLETISDDLAISHGIGRSSGQTVRILENGNLFYSGFEFSPQK